MILLDILSVGVSNRVLNYNPNRRTIIIKRLGCQFFYIIHSDFLIVWFGNCVLGRMIWSRSLVNTTLLVDNRLTCDQRVDASISTIKYWNDPLDRVIGPHISPWISSKNDGYSVAIFTCDGLVISFPWKQATQDKSLDDETILFFMGCPFEFSIIFASLWKPDGLNDPAM